ncbi:MAG: aldo/keto reductase [Desulfobulbaceae bacterium]|nr:aldo/keto reductase [Desulfobulbaceae bacterium]
MLYRKFGKTGLSLSVLSAGCMRSMQSWQDAPAHNFIAAEQNKLQAIVQEALRLGINHIETARGYGSSERQLGAILPQLDRNSFYLQTKVAPEDDPALFTVNVLDSLNRMGVDYVDLLACHGINTYHELWQCCRPGGCLAAARELQQQGKVRWIGLSGHASADILLAAVRHEGDGGFDYINLHWYAIFQVNTPVFAAARQRDMGVFIISPSDKGGMLYEPPKLLRNLSQPLAPMQFNDLFCLLRPEVHTISVGAARPEDFLAHVKALSCIDQPELVQNIYERWQEMMLNATGWQTPDTHWHTYPAYTETPGYINLPYIFWLYHLAVGWDMRTYARSRYARLGQDIHWVQGNSAAHALELDWTNFTHKHGFNQEQLCSQLQQAHALLSQPKADG